MSRTYVSPEFGLSIFGVLDMYCTVFFNEGIIEYTTVREFVLSSILTSWLRANCDASSQKGDFESVIFDGLVTVGKKHLFSNLFFVTSFSSIPEH